ncbi:serine hydrolase [uncultured Victivallis sp.]|uniref:serine hydrolase domain-containing protein n=1 Tax=Victivallis sp. TaxID=2049020 RepID=UPI0025D0320E|nr:serine hydrolase domain-containing protein [uncultured Victivallis sp.]
MYGKWEEIIGDEINDGVIDGAALLVCDPERELFQYACGEAADGVAMNCDTIIDVASVTKAVATATALLLCHSRGMVDFDAPFTRYLPDFTAPLPGGPITVRELALHISGFSHENQPERQYFAEDGCELLRNTLRFPPLFPPRTHFEYACWNYLLLGQIVERITGRRLTEFCQTELFEPLGMTDSSLGRPVITAPGRLAQTCGTNAPGEISDFVAFRVYRDGGCAGNAGMFSTARDLGKFCRMLLQGGRLPGGGELFPEARLREFTVNAMPPHLPVKRSFGWIMRDAYRPESASDQIIYHSGWSGQTLYIDFGLRLCVVVLTTRRGDYERAKRDRSRIASLLLEKFTAKKKEGFR